jgi:hypothetical protein
MMTNEHIILKACSNEAILAWVNFSSNIPEARMNKGCIY